jgi:hypothetical protein
MNVLAVLQGIAIVPCSVSVFCRPLADHPERACFRPPGIWFALSLLLRLGMGVLGFVWAARQGWQQLVAALGGFIVVRSVLSGRARHQVDSIQQGKEESRDEHQS